MITLSPWLDKKAWMDYLRLASCISVFLSFDRYQNPLFHYLLSLNWKNKLNQSSLSWVIKPTMWRCCEHCSACTYVTKNQLLAVILQVISLSCRSILREWQRNMRLYFFKISRLLKRIFLFSTSPHPRSFWKEDILGEGWNIRLEEV